MKMRRIVSAEGKAGVVMQVDDLLDTETADRVTNIWGFDKIPQLPLTPEQVLGEYKRLGIFGPKGLSPRRSPSRSPREGGRDGSRELDGQDRLRHRRGYDPRRCTAVGCTGPTPSISRWCSGRSGYRLSGRRRPSAHEIHAKEGDFFVQNGAFHEFHNRSDDPS